MNRHSKIESVSRCGVFVDVQNVFYTAKNDYKSKMDYSNLIEFLAANRDIVVANAYLTSKVNLDIRSFEEALKNCGYDVKKKFYDPLLTEARHPSWEAGISIDMMNWSSKLDTVILVSGNGAFVDVFKYLKGKVRLELANYPKATSSDLRELADEFIDLSPPKLVDQLLRKNAKFDDKYTGLPQDEEEEVVGNKING